MYEETVDVYCQGKGVVWRRTTPLNTEESEGEPWVETKYEVLYYNNLGGEVEEVRLNRRQRGGRDPYREGHLWGCSVRLRHRCKGR